MKITKVRTVLVQGRRKQAYGRMAITALGGSNISEYVIVFIDTDEGITGIGEISSVFTRQGRLLCRDVDALLGPALAGEDPFALNHLILKMDRTLHGSEPAKAALEMALWDIKGKALGVPVYQLLGGLVREKIPLSYSITFGEPKQMADAAIEKAEAGFRTVKVKVGREDPRIDVAAVKAVREAVGEEKRVRVDANMAWRSAKEAVRIIRDMEPYRPELIEQPLQPRELDGLAEIRRHVAVPIMVDESVWGPRDTMEVIRRSAADVVNVYVSESGGIQNASKTFAMCQHAGLLTLIGSMPEFGIGTAAQIHLGVAMPNLDFDSDTCGVLYHEEDLLTEPLRFEKGYAFPPTGPGLGVTIDEAILARWTVEK